MLINSWLIIVVGNLGQVWGTVSLQATMYILVCSSDKYWFVSVTYIAVCQYILCMSWWLWTPSFGCLFNPDHVNQGGVQKTTPQVTLYKSDIPKESLRRCRADMHSQLLSGHADKAWELFLACFHHMRGFVSLVTCYTRMYARFSNPLHCKVKALAQ